MSLSGLKVLLILLGAISAQLTPNYPQDKKKKLIHCILKINLHNQLSLIFVVVYILLGLLLLINVRISIFVLFISSMQLKWLMHLCFFFNPTPPPPWKNKIYICMQTPGEKTLSNLSLLIKKRCSAIFVQGTKVRWTYNKPKKYSTKTKVKKSTGGSGKSWQSTVE